MKRLGERAEATSVVYIAWNTPDKAVSTEGPRSPCAAPDRFWHPVMLNEASPEKIKDVWLHDPYDGMESPPVSTERIQELYRDLPDRSEDYIQQMYESTPEASPEQLAALYQGCRSPPRAS